MSGALVAEVLDAATQLEAEGLRARAFHALIAIASRAHGETRQGSVRWSTIQAAQYGKSLPTAKRAVAELKAAGLIRVVKRGFNNHAGRSAAPIYEVTERISQMSRSVQLPMDHLGEPVGYAPTDQPDEPLGEGPTDQIGDRTDQIGDRTDHSCELLDGSIDGSTDGGRGMDFVVVDEPDAPDPLDLPQPRDDDASVRRRPRCALHAHLPDDDPGPDCVGCRDARLEDEAQKRKAQAEDDARRERIRRAINACRHCDDFARLDDLSDCPRHPNFRPQRNAS